MQDAFIAKNNKKKLVGGKVTLFTQTKLQYSKRLISLPVTFEMYPEHHGVMHFNCDIKTEPEILHKWLNYCRSIFNEISRWSHRR